MGDVAAAAARLSLRKVICGCGARAYKYVDRALRGRRGKAKHERVRPRTIYGLMMLRLSCRLSSPRDVFIIYYWEGFFLSGTSGWWVVGGFAVIGLLNACIVVCLIFRCGYAFNYVCV